MRLVILKTLDPEKPNLPHIISLMSYGDVIIGSEFTKTHFDILHKKVQPIANKYSYIQSFTMTKNSYLYFYFPKKYNHTEVATFVNKTHI